MGYWRVTCRTRLTGRTRDHGPLQDQPARHRVQPLRGPRPPGGAGPRPVRRHGRRHRARDAARGRAAGRARARRVLLDADRNPPVFDPATYEVTLPESFPRATRPTSTPSGGALDLPAELGGTVDPAVAALGRRRDGARRQPGRAHVLRRLGLRQRALRASAPTSRSSWPAPGRPPLGRHHGAHRAGRRLRRRRRPHQGRRSSPTAPGTSRASSASSPRPSTT